MKKNITFFVVISCIAFHDSLAQWTKINSIPTQEIVALARMNDTLYAASGTDLIYKSADAGTTWIETSISNEPIEIFTLKEIDQKLFIGTYNHGIFISQDFGATWTNSGMGFPAVSGFEKFDNHIYTSTVGSGVYRYDTTHHNWIPFNNELPSNLAYNVETIVSTSNQLLIGAGGNGTFFHYDFIADQWVLGFYYGNLLPGLIITKIINHDDTLFAINHNRIIRSNDGGQNWNDDKAGTHNGDSRYISLGTHHLYTITNLLNGGTWIQKRNKVAGIRTNWSLNEELFPTGYAYDIIEFNNQLFLAKEDGLHVRDLTLSSENAIHMKSEVTIFPNPLTGRNINISSPVPVHKIFLQTISGQTIYESSVRGYDFELPSLAKGLYIVTLVLSNHVVHTRKLVIN